MATYAEQMSKFGLSLTLKSIPKAVRTRAKACVLDTLGVCLASACLDFATMAAGFALGMGGDEESTVIGWDARVPAPNAALLNGTLAHGADYDDTHAASRLHPSAAVVPTALAVGEGMDTSGRAVVETVVAGLEVVTRIGMAGAGPAGFHQRGIHPTTLCGAFSSALVASKLLGLDVEHSSWALGLAGGMASGSYECLSDGTWAKRIGPGWAAHAGITAAQLAARGFTGPRTVFEGKAGLYRSHLGEGNYDLSKLSKGLGERWETLSIAAKRFPCCHRNQAHVQLALAIREEHSLMGSEINGVECGVDRLAVPLVCEPWKEKLQPHDGYAAKFSLAYCVAAALTRGRLTLGEFELAAVRDEEIRGLAKRTSYSIDKELDPLQFPGWLRVRTKDGRILEARKESEKLPAWPEIRTKFLENASPKLGGVKATRVVEMVERLEELSDVGRVMRLCA